jgi:starch synthase (maltosyl-transferring)
LQRFISNLTKNNPNKVAAPARVVIESVRPQVDGGRYPIKRVIGEEVQVEADVFADGHDAVACELLWKYQEEKDWKSVPMDFRFNDHWVASFTVEKLGRYQYRVRGWTDPFLTWRRDLVKRRDAEQDLSVDFLIGARLIKNHILSDTKRPAEERYQAAMTADVPAPAPESVVESEPVLEVVVDPVRARFSTWYEMFPRSARGDGKHATFKDVIDVLPYVEEMGFDVLYFPPIHPIGTTNRKGRNNAVTAAEGDPGSPYAIGSAEGGHDAVHPELGTLEDFRGFVTACKLLDMEVALDFAVQCSPDHPWIKAHPLWFRRRPDGSMRYAENPPKKYEDIVNPDFSSEDAGALWNTLRDVVLFWIDQGVKIFRVDNPHTKPFRFWEWLIHGVQLRHPDVIFLAEAFTRPKLMKGLAKLGFTQSYTYFTWRTQKWELEQYLNELTAYPERDFYRPNFFVNTPDILPYHLQSGETWMFKSRAALAATLSSTYGIYNGFELLEHEPIPGKEEYLDSEKYEIKVRDWDKPGNIKPYLRDLNRARRDNAALQQTSNLRFIPVEDSNIIAFVKESVNQTNSVIVAIALSRDVHEVWVPLGDVQVGMAGDRRNVAAVENLMTGERYPVEWGGIRLRIDPVRDPALLFRCLA